MHTLPPRQWRAMKLIWPCFCKRNIMPQIETGASIPFEPHVSRWERTHESGRLVAQGSNGKQRHLRCSQPRFSGWSACSPLRHQGSSLAHIAACSKNFAEFSQEHFSNFEDSAASSKKDEREYEAAKNSAAGSLSLRPHSRKELEGKLKDKGYSSHAIGRALDRLKELALQSDADYAEVYTRSKWRQSRWAPSRIQQELVRKGVSRQDCQTALEGVFGESSRGRIRVDLGDLGEEDVGTCTLFGTEGHENMKVKVKSKVWQVSAKLITGRIDQQLLASAQRRADMSEGLPSEARKRRLTGWLLRRGHDWDTVSKLVALLKL